MYSSYARCSAEGTHRRTPAPTLVAVTLLALVAACSPAEVTVSPTTTTRPVCAVGAPDLADIGSAEPDEAAALLSGIVFECSPKVVVAATADLEPAAALAVDLGAPVLVAADDASLSEATRAELERLDPEDVIVISDDESLPWTNSTTGVGGSWDIDIRPVPDLPARAPTTTSTTAPDETTTTESADETGTGDQTDATDSEPSPGADPPEAPPVEGPVWLARTPDLQWAITPAMAATGHAVALAADPGFTRVDGDVWVIGDFTPTERWQTVAPFIADEVAGGGYTIFPGRRFVAFYGSPVTFRLGLLGETGPEEALARLDEYLPQYDDSVGPIVPTFELIVTVADSRPGDDGDYSRELTVDQVRPWVDVITEAGGYAILDLQPGRTDFLTQARRYEELLRRPNVGLALDPEWRLKPDQVHLRQIGTVDAAEINLVVDWLAELVREEGLPQKMLVLHQFKFQMITNRERIETPPELAVVLHVDGQGPLGTKYETWDALVGAPTGANQTLWWGWKNFLDEDTPMATPTQVDDVEPLPLVVTYQ